uniref:Uncharacterized protein n=1 Tax=Gasterosteus aculeatus aculeatus TaxID=481459 RepID=A0AAQ4QTB5_GASAC
MSGWCHREVRVVSRGCQGGVMGMSGWKLGWCHGDVRVVSRGCQGGVMGMDCSTCQCFPAKGARVRLRLLAHRRQLVHRSREV